MTIDAPCLDCGEPVRVVVRDGKILNTDPEEISGYIDIPFGQWRKYLSYS